MIIAKHRPMVLSSDAWTNFINLQFWDSYRTHTVKYSVETRIALFCKLLNLWLQSTRRFIAYSFSLCIKSSKEHRTGMIFFNNINETFTQDNLHRFRSKIHTNTEHKLNINDFCYSALWNSQHSTHTAVIMDEPAWLFCLIGPRVMVLPDVLLGELWVAGIQAQTV